MPFTIIRQDITKMKVDAVVNAANSKLMQGGGVCGAIFKAAGADLLQRACDKLSLIATGDAVITPGFELPAHYIIHTAGPVYKGGSRNEAALLRSCYINSLRLAADHGCLSIAFPLISSGIYGYPKLEALKVATDAIRDFLADKEGDDIDVYLTVFDREAVMVGENLLGEIESFIDENYVRERLSHEYRRDIVQVDQVEESDFEQLLEEDIMLKAEAVCSAIELNAYIENLDEPFAVALMRLIDAKGQTDVKVYKRANLSRKLFSKIRTIEGYMPGKRTALALAVALELSLDETEDLLRRAGYALSHSQMSDVIIEYFIINKRYDIFEINEVLFKYDQPLLGG